MTLEDQRAIMQIDRASAIEAIYERLNRVSEETRPYLPRERQQELVQSLMQVQENSQALAHMVEHAETLLKEAAQYVDSAQAGINTMKDQRDAVADELSTLLNDLLNGDFHTTPTNQEIFEQAVEQHEETFYQELPYRIMNALGNGWTESMAENLYSLIASDYEIEEVAELLEADAELIQEFRDRLRELMIQFMEATRQ